MATRADGLRRQISELVKEYYDERFKQENPRTGKGPVRYAGRVFDHREMQRLVDSSLDFWLTSGRFSDEFEADFSDFVGVEYAMLTNSGSSANLLAFSALTSPLLGEKRLRPGDEVIAVAAGFPTTVNPIVQNNMKPVFVDIELGTYNAKIEHIRDAVSKDTRAIFLAHTLGNPYDLDEVTRIARENDLWLIEDCCDALGSTYKGRHVGTFGNVATCSFYPAHHITMGEGGVVFTDDSVVARAVTSFRDWGRDCYCKGGENNTCGRRFSGQYGDLPYGYDHKYVYSHIGYNLKVTDMQAAIGVEQLQKLPDFVNARKRNFAAWQEGFRRWEECFYLPVPTEGSDPAWFAFPISVRPEAPFSRTDLTDFLSVNEVETRNLFGGNLLRQPAYLEIPCRVVSDLQNTDYVAENTFFLGTYPGLDSEQIERVLRLVQQFVDERTANDV